MESVNFSDTKGVISVKFSDSVHFCRHFSKSKIGSFT